MILPPRPQNHRPLDRSRRTLDLPVTVDPPLPQNRPELDRFAVPPWNPRSPEWLAIEDSLPADHRARAIDEAVDQLDLALLFASYLGVGSKAHRPDLMLKIALYEIQTGHHSPDQWAKDTCDRRCLQWLGLGIAPSRSRWYAFRDRVGPLLETFHRQILEGAVAQGLTTASRGSLDGTLIAAQGVIAPVPGIMRLFWAFSSSNPPESPSQEDSSLANMPDTLEARCRSDGPPAGPRSIDPLPGSRSFLTVSAVA